MSVDTTQYPRRSMGITRGSADSHILISAKHVRRLGTSKDEAVRTMLQRGSIWTDYCWKVIRQTLHLCDDPIKLSASLKR